MMETRTKSLKKIGSMICIIMIVMVLVFSFYQTSQLRTQVNQLNDRLDRADDRFTNVSKGLSELSDNYTQLSISYVSVAQKFALAQSDLKMARDLAESIQRDLDISTQMAQQITVMYTGNPFATELWPGSFQSENITGMHWYTYMSGILQNVTDTFSYPYQTYSYLIFFDGTSYQAKNGSTGQIDFIDSDAEDIIETVWTNLTSGGIIILSPGRSNLWTLDDTIDSQNDAVQLIGSGRLLELECGAGLFDDEDVISVTHDHVTIQNVFLDGNMETQPDFPAQYNWGTKQYNEQRGIKITGDYGRALYNYIQNVAEYGITISSSVGGVAQGNWIYNASWNGIHLLTGSTGAKAIGNEITVFSDVGIGMYGDYPIVSNNYIHDSGADTKTGSTNTSWGIGIEGGKHALVSNNIIENCSLGIGVGGTTYHPDHWTIEGNMIDDIVNKTHVNELSVGHYIMVGYGPGLVQGNFLDGILNFHASNAYSAGIMLESGSADIHVADNTFCGTTYLGIYVNSQSDMSIHGNRFNDEPTYAIYLLGTCTRMVITDNVANDGTQFIHASGAVDNSKISGNWMYSMSGTAIDIQNADGLMISDNMIRNCVLGVDISNAAVSNAWMMSNDFYGCTNSVNDAGATVVYGYNVDKDGAMINGTEPDP